MLPIKTILHSTDFSEPSKCALELACGLASDYGASLVVIHVMAAPMGFSDGLLIPRPDRSVAGIHQQLDELDIPDDRIDVIRQIEEGNAATEIVKMARLCHADIIVMGSHGRDGLRRWIMGSVAEAVMRRAACPVLTVAERTFSSLPGEESRPKHAHV